MDKVEQLVKMANQIADNFSFHEDAAVRVGDHLQRFWAPSMRRELVEFNARGGDGLKPAVIEAISGLRPDQ